MTHGPGVDMHGIHLDSGERRRGEQRGEEREAFTNVQEECPQYWGNLPAPDIRFFGSAAQQARGIPQVEKPWEDEDDWERI